MRSSDLLPLAPPNTHHPFSSTPHYHTLSIMSTVRASLTRLLPAGSASTSKTLTLFPALVAPRGCRLSRSFIGNYSSQPFATSPLAFATASNNDSNPQDPYKQTDQNAPDLKQRVDELVKLIKSVGVSPSICRPFSVIYHWC